MNSINAFGALDDSNSQSGSSSNSSTQDSATDNSINTVAQSAFGILGGGPFSKSRAFQQELKRPVASNISGALNADPLSTASTSRKGRGKKAQGATGRIASNLFDASSRNSSSSSSSSSSSVAAYLSSKNLKEASENFKNTGGNMFGAFCDSSCDTSVVSKKRKADNLTDKEQPTYEATIDAPGRKRSVSFEKSMDSAPHTPEVNHSYRDKMELPSGGSGVSTLTPNTGVSTLTPNTGVSALTPNTGSSGTPGSTEGLSSQFANMQGGISSPGINGTSFLNRRALLCMGETSPGINRSSSFGMEEKNTGKNTDGFSSPESTSNLPFQLAYMQGGVNSSDFNGASLRNRASSFEREEKSIGGESIGTTVALGQMAQAVEYGEIPRGEELQRDLSWFGKTNRIARKIQEGNNSKNAQIVQEWVDAKVEKKKQKVSGASYSAVKEGPFSAILQSFFEGSEDTVVDTQHLFGQDQRGKGKKKGTGSGFHFCEPRDARARELKDVIQGQIIEGLGPVFSANYKGKRSTFAPYDIETKENYCNAVKRALKEGILAEEGSRALSRDPETGLFIEAYYDTSVRGGMQRVLVKSAFCPFAVINPADSDTHSIAGIVFTKDELVNLANESRNGDFTRFPFEFEDGEYVDIGPALGHQTVKQGVYVKLLHAQKTAQTWAIGDMSDKEDAP